MAQRRFLVASMSPLPAELVKALMAPYLAEAGLDVEVVSVHGRPREEVKRILAEADVVLGDHTFSMPIDRDLCMAMKRVRLIQQPSTGYDHIDVEACREAGVPVANAGGANSASVAEYTIMAALALLKRLMEAHEATARGGWPQWELMDKGTFDLYGKTWGIIGLGRIGREVARHLKGWGVKIVYYDKARAPEDVERRLGVEYRTLRRLLRESDVVSIHVPLTRETRGMIGEAELRAMKPTAVLVNPSRGEVVDEEALARALRERWIAGAAVDVYSREPPGPDHPLIRLAREGGVNLIVTPHIAGANTDSRQRIIQFSVENVIRVLKGGEPEAVVNM